jgi:hypothetical protein
MAFEHGVPLKEGITILNAPYHWIRALSMYSTVKAIHQNAAYDPEKKVAPKILWFDGPGLERWYQDRKGK